ncbi:hypothetical protein AB0F91_44675 [Amycolatopsis sp. NPDC023774]|uniref:hypothetical protein n=1 Tax=Amycolatopsis sp. NPDC023774 TaxID=3155015 RepID=UPI00340CA513
MPAASLLHALQAAMADDEDGDLVVCAQQTAWSVSAPRHAAEDVDPSEVLAEGNRQL